MELLGIGANMQGSSNCPNFCFAADLKEILRGCTWPQTNKDKMIDGGHSSKGFLSTLSTGLCIGYDREALKQIMLKQEAIFRDQIHELHRLYTRHREFIAEMKRRESYRLDICIGSSQSDFHKFQISKSCAQDAHNLPAFNQSFILGKQKTLPSTQGKNMPSDPDSVLHEIGTSNPYLSEIKSKILGKRMFDLEFPRDNDLLHKKDELLLVEKFSEVRKMSSYDHQSASEIVHVSDEEPFLASHNSNGSLCRNFSTTNSASGKPKLLVDLNDSLSFEEEPGSRSHDAVDATGHREISFSHPYGKTHSKLLVFSEEDIPGTENGRFDNGHLESSGVYDSSKTDQHLPDKDVADSSPSSATFWKKSARSELIASHIFMNESSQPLIENPVLYEDEDKLSGLKNLRCSVLSDTVSCIEGSFCNDFKSESMRTESYPSFKASANWLEGQIDLNICIDEELLPTPSSNEIKLEVPANPRKEKHSSPSRGEFDVSQVGTNFLKSVQDKSKPFENLIGIAAEALVSLSSSVAQNCPETTNCKSAEDKCDSLWWFAQIVSSMESDPEKVEVEMKSKNASGSEELLPGCTDDFEIMTLKLTEAKVEVYSSNVSGQEVKNFSFSSSQPGKGHTRRSQQENFQAEALPSLATLARHEVTEDIQTIGGLMEAAYSQSVTGVMKIPSRSKTVSARGTRRSGNSSSKITRSVRGSIMDQKSSSNERGIEERNVFDWRNITRRRRGQRCPTSNQNISLGHV